MEMVEENKKLARMLHFAPYKTMVYRSGLRMTDFAKLMGMNYQQLCNILNGNQLPELGFTEKMGVVLKKWKKKQTYKKAGYPKGLKRQGMRGKAVASRTEVQE